MMIVDYYRMYNTTNNTEFEVRFGTKGKKLTNIDIKNVSQKLKSLGFTSNESDYTLKIQTEYIDSSGLKKMSSVRIEINGLLNIRDYCRTTQLMSDPLSVPDYINFVLKKNIVKDDTPLRPIDFDEYNFRVSLQHEATLNTHKNKIVRDIIEKWDKTKKTFRLVKRTSFTHADYPYTIDISIVKSSRKSIRNKLIPAFTFTESNCVDNEEAYELEIEALREEPGKETLIQDRLKKLKYIISNVLSGIQQSNFPIQNSKKLSVGNEYYTLVNKKRLLSKLYPKDFIGPQSISLEMENIQDSSNNVLSEYVVTDKADGIRKMLFIDKVGDMYLIDINMNIQFTGVKSKKLKNTLIDGEHIVHNKRNEYYNVYAAFDIYIIDNKDVRMLPFVSDELGNDKTRLKILNMSIGDITTSEMSTIFQLSVKRFHGDPNIFKSCNDILTKKESGLFEYETDGLIFTNKSLGVGQNEDSDEIVNKKKTCTKSFKWKPPEFNTIDFLVTVNKNESGNDIVNNIFEKGESMDEDVSIQSYKTITLRVGYDENKHGHINPCESILHEKYRHNVDYKYSYRPVPFIPSDPEDINASTCKIILDDNNNMLTEHKDDIIDDNTIVEFRYDDSKQTGYKWIPIRVRYDKTADLRSGGKNYGNAYHVALSVWHSIHSPISDKIIASGENIPEYTSYKYYNSARNNSRYALRDFHNLGIKKYIIQGVSKPGFTLMDTSVGKAGDMSKWVSSKLRFVLGIDINKDNIVNRFNGACSRYLNTQSKNKGKLDPKAIFLNGDTSLSIENGDAFYTERDKNVMLALLGKGARDADSLGSLPYKLFGTFKDGFNIISSQFSVHYYFKDKETLGGFMTNVSKMCKIGGYFIGTCFDGKRVFSRLQGKEINGGVSQYINEKKLFEIIKLYDNDEFNDDETSLGCGINVYQESINSYFKEYLVNFDYFERMLNNYGFRRLTTAELKELNILDSVSSFESIFKYLQSKVQDNPKLAKDYNDMLNLTEQEKYVSFLNNVFVFKKVNDISLEPLKRSEKIVIDPDMPDPDMPSLEEVDDDDTPEQVSPKETVPKKKKNKRFSKNR